MFCTHCGSQIDENVKFCTNCGMPIEENATANAQEHSEANGNSFQGESKNTSGTWQDGAAQQTFQQPNMQKNNTEQYKLLLQIFTGIFAVIFVIQFIVGFVSFIGTALEALEYLRFIVMLSILLMISVVALLQAVISLASAAAFGLTAIKYDKEHSDSLFITGAMLRSVSLLVGLISCFLTFIKCLIESDIYAISGSVVSFLLSILFYVIVVGGFYGILYLMGENPIKGIAKGHFVDSIKASVKDVIELAKTLGSNKNQAPYAQNVQQPVYEQSKAQQTAATTNMSQQPVNSSQNTYYQGANAQTGGMNQMNQGYMPNGSAYLNKTLLKTDRNLILYIIFTILTCGIYAWYFIYMLAKDINIACDGDGESTPGLLAYIVLTIITCGLYSWYWLYKIGNRLANNAPRYGMQFQENGTTVIMWYVIGVLLCGLGSFVGMNIIIKNTNIICTAYNRANFSN